MNISEHGQSMNTNRQEIRRCIRCIMPENYPEVSIDDEGVCNFCRVFDTYWNSWIDNPEAQAESEKRLRLVFETAKRKKKPYDILIGLSGGKDSSYMLHLCREVYDLNVLTFTNDSGILTEGAKSRIDQMVKRYKVKHIYCSEPLFAELAGVFVRKTGNFCTVCELSNYNFHSVLLREYDIPLCAIGSSSRTEAGVPKYLNPWDPWYFKQVLKGEPFRERLHCSSFNRNYILRTGIETLLGRLRLVILPDYLEWDDDKISALFNNELGFNFGEEHSDCYFYKVADYLHGKKYHGNHPKTAKLSLMVRTGKLSREDALLEVSKPFHTGPPEGIERFLEFTGITPDEFKEASEKTPATYLNGISRLFNLVRKKMRRQAG